MNEGDWSASRSGRFIPGEEAASNQGTGGAAFATFKCFQFVLPASAPTSVPADVSTTALIISVAVSTKCVTQFISSMTPTLLTLSLLSQVS